MIDDHNELMTTLRKIHDLLELLAEDKIAERDAKQRRTLIDIVGSSTPMQRSVLLMDGTRTQTEIHAETAANKGHLSTLVGKLSAAKLLDSASKHPKLTISIPSNFFDKNVQQK
jgi:hypothetical protein